MRLFLSLLAIIVLLPWQVALGAEYRKALPGYKFSFPRDHASHNDFKTEWWYYTGHVHTREGRKFGYELTFFRSAVDIADRPKRSRWSVDNIYLAHFALSDEQNKQFMYCDKLTRPGKLFGGADEHEYKVWNEGWEAALTGNTHLLKARSVEQTGKGAQKSNQKKYAINFVLTAAKPPVVHGQNGVSQKAACKGCASHYYSFTRLDTKGQITLDGQRFPVTGISWMDHEFGSNQLAADQVGWDWFSVQLNDKIELMFYIMRLKDGTIDPHSSGTIVYDTGKTEHLSVSDYKITPVGQWRSPISKGVYPMGWRIAIPKLKADLTLNPAFENQELNTGKSTGVTYWEGSCSAAGTISGQPIDGQAYVEMTGYAQRFNNRI